ncbi:MAG: hypothetical protein FJ316_03730 [SAR202 cluster bacterium]|nr:hypothetical protein [SAR202 cluster bacterium]
MPKVETAQEATELAIAFLKPYWAFARPLRAVRRPGLWHVELDVGVRGERLGWADVDMETGKIVNYRIPKEA